MKSNAESGDVIISRDWNKGENDMMCIQCDYYYYIRTSNPKLHHHAEVAVTVVIGRMENEPVK